jgi:hypothetical protein
MEGTPLAELDRTALVEFLDRVRELLRSFLKNRQKLISPETQALLQRAWEELEGEGRFEQVQDAIRNRDVDARLAEHGLGGAQLAAKIGIFENAAAEVEHEEEKRFGRWKRRRGVWAWALKAGNVVLGSLSSVIPGAGAIQEFKDAAETALDERVPLRKRILRRLGRGADRPAVTAGPTDGP